MKLRIRKIDKDLPLPEYKTAGAAGFDLCARVAVSIPAKSAMRVPLNVVLAPPEGYMVILAARSSLHKKGLMLANGVGIMDHDFCGNDDEYHAALYNFIDAPVSIKRGERIVQGILKKHERAEWEEVDDLQNPTRGGFGTTGAS